MSKVGGTARRSLLEEWDTNGEYDAIVKVVNVGMSR
jgi:hypothetical protein